MKLNSAKISLLFALLSLIILAVHTAKNIEPTRAFVAQEKIDLSQMGMVDKAIETEGIRISSYSFLTALIGLVFGIVGTHSRIKGAKNYLLYNFILMICSFVPFYVLFL